MGPLPTNRDVDQLAQIIWDYHRLHHSLHKTDAIVVLGSLDTRVAERGAQLFLDGYSERLIFSGGVGALTRGKFTKSEAEHFADIAVSMNVPRESILLEPDSTNTGENIRFSYKLMRDNGVPLDSLIVVQKPYMERRTFATFRKQWPNARTKLMITSPEISYRDYPNAQNPKDLVINIMVGDLQRIREYPKLGFQIEQDIPEEVWRAYKQLVSLGYTDHLIQALDS